jgi:thiamine-monophosphate kinase
MRAHPASRLDERGRIDLLARTFAASGPGVALGLEVGIGDDAAVLSAAHAAKSIVWTIDEQVEAVHFRREFLSWPDLGWRSLMAAASDVAAMGAVPWCVLCALVLPDDVDDDALGAIAQGQREAAEAIGAPVVGGNLSGAGSGHGLSLATTLLGTCDRAVKRSGALPGDGLWLAGHLGLAAGGLRAIERGGSARELDAAKEAWRRPRALIAEGRQMAPVAHAAIDVSDGLARDVGHVAEASSVCIALDARALLADPVLAAAAAALGESAVDLALHGGEDYALVVASPVPIAGFRLLGEVREGRGLVLSTAAGERVIEPRGFDHFQART